MKDSRWMVIANPEAGSGKVAKDWTIIAELLKEKGISFDYLFTDHKYHSIELMNSSIKKGYKNFIAVGGDGTIHEVINGIFFQQDVPHDEMTLAVIPAGSGNDWIKTFNISEGYRDAISAIALGRSIKQDVSKIHLVDSMVEHTRYMANALGVGYDAMTCLYSNKAKESGRNGKSVYIRAAIKAFFTHRSKHYSIKVDGKPFFDGKVFSISLGNGRFTGGGMQQTPDAIVDDGFINLLIIPKIPKIKIIFHFPKLFSGKIYNVKELLYVKGRKFEVFSTPNDRVEIDGEVFGYTPMRLEIIPKAINVVVGENFKQDPHL